MPETSVPAAHAGMTPHGGSLRAPGAILVVSCYELGHQPLGLAWPMAFLERAGYAPRALDLALEPLDEAVVGAARLTAIMAPMHTALRLGVPAAHPLPRLHPRRRIVVSGLLAPPCAPVPPARRPPCAVGGGVRGWA